MFPALEVSIEFLHAGSRSHDLFPSSIGREQNDEIATSAPEPPVLKVVIDDGPRLDRLSQNLAARADA
jgi:hypothetical protein